MSRLVSLCVEPGCQGLAPRGQARCPTHEPLHRARVSARKQAASKRKGYGTSHWQKVRKARLELDEYRCTIGLEGCDGLAWTVDLDPACGGNHRLATLENTRSACRRCHGRLQGGLRYGGTISR